MKRKLILMITIMGIFLVCDTLIVTANEGLSIEPVNQITEKNSEAKEMMESMKGFLSIITGIIMLISILLIVYAGFKYAIGQGDPKQLERSKMQIVFAGLGLMFALMAFWVLSVVLSEMEGTMETEKGVGMNIGVEGDMIEQADKLSDASYTYEDKAFEKGYSTNTLFLSIILILSIGLIVFSNKKIRKKENKGINEKEGFEKY